jgi:hypothetical protein
MLYRHLRQNLRITFTTAWNPFVPAMNTPRTIILGYEERLTHMSPLMYLVNLVDRSSSTEMSAQSVNYCGNNHARKYRHGGSNR